MPRAESPDELFARSLVEAALHIPLRWHDDGTLASMYDYDILWPDRDPGAMEVVRWADQQSMKDARAWFDHATGPFPVPSLNRSWILVLDAAIRPKFKGLLANTVDLLRELEAAGRWDARPGDWHPWTTDPDAEVLRRLLALGIRYVTAVDPVPGEGPQLYANLASGTVTPWSTEPIVDAVDACLATHADVAGKLAASGRLDCHAFIVLDQSRDVATRAWRFWPAELGFPSRAPTLVPPITQIWISPAGADSVWTWSTAGWAAFSARGERV